MIKCEKTFRKAFEVGAEVLNDKDKGTSIWTFENLPGVNANRCFAFLGVFVAMVVREGYLYGDNHRREEIYSNVSFANIAVAWIRGSLFG